MQGEDELAATLRAHLAAILTGGPRISDATIAAAPSPSARELLEKLRALADRHREQVRFTDSIIENVPDMIFVKDAAELRFARFNKAGERLLGFPREAMLGKNDYDFFPRDEADFFTANDRQVLESGQQKDIPEEPIHTKDGLRWLHTKKVPILGEDGAPRYLLGISEDITDRKAWAELESKHKAELERSNRELEQFAYVASHDLQEPLRTVASFVQLLEHEYKGRLDAAADEYIHFAVDGVRRMQDLIRGLLAYSRIQSQASTFQEAALVDVLALVQLDLAQAVAEAGATLEIRPLPTVVGDFDQLRQLFQNLVANALKFRHPARPARVEVGVEDSADATRFYVRDNGIGIQTEHASAIFEMFTRLHAVGEYPGTGIGLSICKKIVERHGGVLRFESDGASGTTFWFTLATSLS